MWQWPGRIFSGIERNASMSPPPPQDPAKPAKTLKAGPTPPPGKSKEKKPAPTAGVSHEKELPDFPVVGIGASAGGLEALEIFFAHLPAHSNMAVVVIQHMSPQHKSSLADLLARKTALRVIELGEDRKVEPGCIYVNPPSKFISLDKRMLRRIPPFKETGGIPLPIDHFFRSLAESMEEKAVCVVLSGTASDGAAGVKAVKAAGGLVFCQRPDNAKYAGMPEAAIATGMVDFVLPVHELPSKIIEVVAHPYLRRDTDISTMHDGNDRHLKQIFSLLRQKTKYDFSSYKQTTVNRRIARRMAVHQVDRLADYVRVLKEDAAEPARLLKDMLIGVTSFFRDPNAFDALRDEVLVPLSRQKKAADYIRIWVPGCSTGEEAYTIAILFAETMDQLDIHCKIQMFASDIDAAAISTARVGEYGKNIAADVSPKRLDRFFSPTDNGFKVREQIRDMIVFSIQNLIEDPPFSRMDLVSCRNLLIYLKQDLQRRVLQTMHYALNPGGVLFLGPSESIGEQSGLYAPVSIKYKIFRRMETNGKDYHSFQHLPTAAFRSLPLPEDETFKTPEMDIFNLTERIVLDEFAPPSVLIDHNFEILHFIGQTDRYLKPPKGKASFKILQMAREGLFYKLKSSLKQAVRTKEQVVCSGLRVNYLEDEVSVDLIVRPVAEKMSGRDLYIVMFIEKDRLTEETQADQAKEAAGNPLVRRLMDELESARWYLQSTVGEMEASNEEFKATNEELQSVNEELQSANEELETSREELQSTNEELVTVNTELQQKIDELTKSNNDINNLLESTEVASLFLNLELCVRRFTPAVTRIINLRHADIGRPITDITTNLAGADLFEPAWEVMQKLVRKTVEVQDRDGRWYEMRILPYRTTENVVDGVTIAFIDITKTRQAEKLQRMTDLFEKSSDAVMIQDFAGNILAWNGKAAQRYGWSPEEALRLRIREITPEAYRDEYDHVAQRLQRGEQCRPFRSQRLTRDGRTVDIWVFVTLLTDDNGRPVEFAAIERAPDNRSEKSAMPRQS